LTNCGEPSRRYDISRTSWFVHEGGSALHAADRLCSGGVVDFPLVDLQTGTGVDDWIAVGVGQTRPELRIKIAGKFRDSRNGRGCSATVRLSVLFP